MAKSKKGVNPFIKKGKKIVKKVKGKGSKIQAQADMMMKKAGMKY